MCFSMGSHNLVQPTHRIRMRLLEVRILVFVLDQNSCNRLQFSFRVMLVPLHCIRYNRFRNNFLFNPSLQSKQGFA